jgi:hypothetical protein
MLPRYLITDVVHPNGAGFEVAHAAQYQRMSPN